MTDPEPIDVEQLKDDEAARRALRRMAALARDFHDYLKEAGLPDRVCDDIVIDWHAQVITSDGVAWEAEDE